MAKTGSIKPILKMPFAGNAGTLDYMHFDYLKSCAAVVALFGIR